MTIKRMTIHAPYASRTTPALVALLAAVAAAVTTCDGSKDPAATGGDTSALREACAAEAAAQCQKLASCWPFVVELLYGDVKTCEERTTTPCVAALSSSGHIADAQAMQACADAYMLTSCEDLLAEKGVPACNIAGSLPVGAPCTSGRQCESALCSYDIAPCGTCAMALPGPGEPCSGTCVKPHFCDETGTCVLRRDVGAPCDSGHPCLPSLNCVAGSCQAFLVEGQSCDPSGTTTASCYAQQGLACDPTAGRCSAIALAAPGQPCGSLATETGCRAGGFCQLEAGMMTGTCIAAAADGDACDTVVGPTCMRPAWCADGSCMLSCPG
jgi:hypothetical protein